MPTFDDHIVRNHQAARATSHPSRRQGQLPPAKPDTTARSRTVFADRQRRRGRILLALTGAFIGLLLAAVRTTALFDVRSVRIEGLSPEGGLTEVERTNTSLAAVIAPGTNWLLAPVHQVQARLTVLPWIQNASVGRRLPLDVVTTVTVRKPAFALVLPGGSYEMGDDGVPIRPLRAAQVSLLCPVYLYSGVTPKLGTPVENTTVRTAATVLRNTLSDKQFHIAKIVIDQNTNIWLNMSTGVRVKIGHCDTIDAKIAMMRKLLSSSIASRFSELNVSNPEAPACRLQGELQAASSTNPAPAIAWNTTQ